VKIFLKNPKNCETPSLQTEKGDYTFSKIQHNLFKFLINVSILNQAHLKIKIWVQIPVFASRRAWLRRDHRAGERPKLAARAGHYRRFETRLAQDTGSNDHFELACRRFAGKEVNVQLRKKSWSSLNSLNHFTLRTQLNIL
jgi:hypothetical protein